MANILLSWFRLQDQFVCEAPPNVGTVLDPSASGEAGLFGLVWHVVFLLITPISETSAVPPRRGYLPMLAMAD